MTKEELRKRINDSENPLSIIDVRGNKDVDSKIERASLRDPDKVKSWAKQYANQSTLVLYCA